MNNIYLIFITLLLFGGMGCSNVSSPYYQTYDFSVDQPTPTLICLNDFSTVQQKTEYTCGAACALMVFRYYDVLHDSEESLSEKLDIRSPLSPRADGGFGCTVEALVHLFREAGFTVESSMQRKTPTFQSVSAFQSFILTALKKKQPILVENVMWGGHWTVIIGYDDMGTDTVNDDVLILADPYDTTDHKQDGYVIKSFERFFYEWLDAGVLHPGITTQSFVFPYKPI